MKRTLYGLNKNGTYQQWSVWTEGDKVVVEFGREGGKLNVKETVCVGKNIGKSNETTAETQSLLEAESKYRAQIERKGYRKTKEELSNLPITAMLAQDYLKVPHKVKFPCLVSAKLDGCFSYGTKIWTSEGMLNIGDIVENKMNVEVASFNTYTNKIEFKKVVNWFNNGVKASTEWRSFNSNKMITNNHKVWDGNTWVMAQDYTEGGMVVSKDALGFITGMLLGDCVAAFEKRRKLASNSHQWRLSYSNVTKDIDYGNEKQLIMDSILGSESRIRTYTSGYGSSMVSYTSKVCRHLPFPIENFYNTDKVSEDYGRRKKDLTTLDLCHFNDISLAIWYFDDGSVQYNNGNILTPRIAICVARYSDSTIDTFMKIFKKLYNVKPHIQDSGVKGKTLVFTTTDSYYLLARIANVAGGLMPRKIPDVFVKTSKPCISLFEKDDGSYIGNCRAEGSRAGFLAYDIEVEDNHNYFAEGMLVHNCRMLYKVEDQKFHSRRNVEFPISDTPLAYEIENFISIANGQGYKIKAIDGELYIHGKALQEINSIVKSTDNQLHNNIEYYIFDIVFEEDLPFNKRYSNLSDLAVGWEGRYSCKYINFLKHYPCSSIEEAEQYKLQFESQDYEGLMFRNLSGVYESGNRSADVLKYKSFLDSETKIIGFSIDNNNEYVFQCHWYEHDVNHELKMKGSHEQRSSKDNENLVGKFVNFKYQDLTKDNKPTFAVGLSVRECNEDGKPLE